MNKQAWVIWYRAEKYDNTINFGITPIISDERKNVVFTVNCQGGAFVLGRSWYSFWAFFLRISTILKTETSSRDDAAKTFFRAAPPPWQSPFWLLLSHFCRNIVQLSSRGCWLDYMACLVRSSSMHSGPLFAMKIVISIILVDSVALGYRWPRL